MQPTRTYRDDWSYLMGRIDQAKAAGGDSGAAGATGNDAAGGEKQENVVDAEGEEKKGK